MKPATGTKKLEAAAKTKDRELDLTDVRGETAAVALPTLTVDRVGVVLLVAGHVLQGHFFQGGPAVLHTQMKGSSF